MSIDLELLAALRLAAAAFGVKELPPAEAEQAVRRAREAFVSVPEATWWWTSLREPRVAVRYGEADGLRLLLRLQPHDTTAVLAVTDDEPVPWPAFKGALGNLVAMVRDVRAFEFWIAPPDSRWIVFDTHENALVVAGSLVEAARDLDPRLFSE